MDKEKIIEQLKNCFLNNEVYKEGLNSLKDNACIEITVERTINCYIYKQSGAIRFSLIKRDADISFQINATALNYLTAVSPKNLAELGIEVIKQYTTNNLQLKAHSSLIKLIRLGYLNPIKQAGSPFSKYLAKYGLTSMSKIQEFICKLKA